MLKLHRALIQPPFLTSVTKPPLLNSGLRLGMLLLAFHFLLPTLRAQAPTVAKSKDAISVLVIGGQNNHDWKIGNEFLLALLNGLPAFSAEESNTPPKGAPATAWDAWDP